MSKRWKGGFRGGYIGKHHPFDAQNAWCQECNKECYPDMWCRCCITTGLHTALGIDSSPTTPTAHVKELLRQKAENEL